MVAVAAAAIGLALTLIGVRFWLDPERARAFFGLREAITIGELHKVVAARDIWLGLLACAFALLRDWRALGLWLGLGTLVCFADAAIVAAAGGPSRAIAFHLVSGLACAVLAVRCARHLSRAPRD